MFCNAFESSSGTGMGHQALFIFRPYNKSFKTSNIHTRLDPYCVIYMYWFYIDAHYNVTAVRQIMILGHSGWDILRVNGIRLVADLQQFELSPFKAWLARGPSTLHMTLQKIQLSSIHSTTYFCNYNKFFNSFIYGQWFSYRLFSKNLHSFMCIV